MGVLLIHGYEEESSRIALAIFRTSCHSLRIETGRHHKPPTPPEDRLCKFCNSGIVDDELHFLTKCQHLVHYRESLYETANEVQCQIHSGIR